eukprot:364513-Chlamydomonas_euryale.AAC.9
MPLQRTPHAALSLGGHRSGSEGAARAASRQGPASPRQCTSRCVQVAAVVASAAASAAPPPGNLHAPSRSGRKAMKFMPSCTPASEGACGGLPRPCVSSRAAPAGSVGLRGRLEGIGVDDACSCLIQSVG